MPGEKRRGRKPSKPEAPAPAAARGPCRPASRVPAIPGKPPPAAPALCTTGGCRTGSGRIEAGAGARRKNRRAAEIGSGLLPRGRKPSNRLTAAAAARRSRVLRRSMRRAMGVLERPPRLTSGACRADPPAAGRAGGAAPAPAPRDPRRAGRAGRPPRARRDERRAGSAGGARWNAKCRCRASRRRPPATKVKLAAAPGGGWRKRSIGAGRWRHPGGDARRRPSAPPQAAAGRATPHLGRRVNGRRDGRCRRRRGASLGKVLIGRGPSVAGCRRSRPPLPVDGGIPGERTRRPRPPPCWSRRRGRDRST